MMNQKQYEKLISTDTFDKLVGYSNQFDIFKMMGVRSKELVHSNILAALFSPDETHGLGHQFVNEFLTQIPSNALSGKEITPGILRTAINGNIRVYRELESIDLVLEFPEIKLVIGIENKIWAIEQDKQLERYQGTLTKRYPNYTSGLIFLTPDGRHPTTHNPELSVPIYCMTYSNILNCLPIEVIKGLSDDVKVFITQFKYHIEKYLSSNKHMDELCWKLFKENEEAYRLMVKSFSSCVYRKVEEQFNIIQEKILSDSMFDEYSGDLKLAARHKKDKTYNIVSNLDITHDSWPDGVAIRLYKWSWMGCFPYIKNECIEKVTTLYPSTKTLTFETVKYFEKEAISNFTHLTGDAAVSNRKITRTGNEITETDIGFSLNKIKELIDDVNRIFCQN